MSQEKFDFVNEYLSFNSGNECPRNYHIWSSFVILAAAVHKRVYVPLGYFNVYPNLYVGLIGDMGSRKSTAKDIAMDLFTETFKDYPILASVQSREDIIKYMNSDACKFSFVNEEGQTVEVRPIVGFINELKNFLSIDPAKSIEFLTDIYSSKRFKSSTIKRGLEDLENPAVNLLACETPEWITDKMKGKIISGGWARRIVYVYETKRSAPIPFPKRPDEYQQIWNRLKEHLIEVSQVSGKFEWDADAAEWYSTWYTQMRNNMPDDKMMAGFYESKHDQATKLAMLLALGTKPIRLRITKENYIRAVAHLDILEENMPKLFSAAGRNELSVPMQLALEILEKNGGWVPEKVWKRLMGKDLDPMEIQQVLRFMQETDQVVVQTVEDQVKVKRVMVMTKQKFDDLKKANQPKPKQE